MFWMLTNDIEKPGFYYWQSERMAEKDKRQVIIVQISGYKIKKPDRKFHAEMCLPVSGSAYDYDYNGPLEEMPTGKFWGPLPEPKI
jgi:hypothetical protein